jgi:transposase-like protein
VCRRQRAQRYRDRHRLRLRRAANLRYEHQIRAEDAGLPTDRSERRITAAIRRAQGPQPCERCGRSAEPFGVETAGPTGPVEIHWSCHSCRTQISNAIAERLESEAQDAMWRRIAGIDRSEPQPSPTPVIRRRRRKKEHVAGTPSIPPRSPVPQLTLAELEERDAEFDRRFADVDNVLARIESALPTRHKPR